MGDAQSGAALKERWRAEARALTSRAIQAARARTLPERDDFEQAVAAAAHGDPALLAGYLRSEQPLTPRHRELLAEVILGTYVLPAPRGRRRDTAARLFATISLGFYKNWRADNACRGIKDFGQAEAMKGEAVRFVMEEIVPVMFNGLEGLDRTRIRELMDRPASRRAWPSD